MRLILKVEVEGQYLSVAYNIVIPELYTQCFNPIDVCDEPSLRFIAGGASPEEATIEMKTREDAADILSKEISKLLILEMKKNDTHNGYKDSDNELQ